MNIDREPTEYKKRVGGRRLGRAGLATLSLWAASCSLDTDDVTLDDAPAGPAWISTTTTPVQQPTPECSATGPLRVMETTDNDPMSQPYLIGVLDAPWPADVVIGEATCNEPNVVVDPIIVRLGDQVLQPCVALQYAYELNSPEVVMACAVPMDSWQE